MKRLLLTVFLVAGTVTAGIAATQVLASGGTAPVYRTSGHDCAIGATDTFDQVGHFNVDQRGATVFGTVELDSVAPRAAYTIILVQNHPCKTAVVGTLPTDSHGFGTLSFQAPAVPGASVAWVLTFHHSHELASTAVPIST